MREFYVHGRNLENKVESSPELIPIFERYQEFIRAISNYTINGDSLHDYVQSFNEYRRDVVYQLEFRKNSGQENLRSSMLEEFFCHLFQDLITSHFEKQPTNLKLGKANSYVDLTFSPKSFQTLFIDPKPYVHTKDQDFVLGASFDMTIVGSLKDKTYSSKFVIPVIAIECKTYIERNMLDSCAGTAKRLKSAMPYCLYIVAAEYMKLRNETPELSDINEIYILCKSTNAERLKLRRHGQPVKEIDVALIVDLYNKIAGHLASIWWSPENALERGKIINRPE